MVEPTSNEFIILFLHDDISLLAYEVSSK